MSILAPPPTCFLKNTTIDAMYENIAVENIKVGDEVKFTEISKVNENKISDVRTEKVKWVGKKIIHRASLITQEEISHYLPVRVSRHAFFDNIPHTDLYLSPFHSVFVNGGLVAVGDLCNGVTVSQCDTFEEIEYYHLEFENFGVVKAHGTLCETFFDVGNRSAFDNVNSFITEYNGDNNIKRPLVRYLNKNGIKQLKYQLITRAMLLLNNKQILPVVKEPNMFRIAV